MHLYHSLSSRLTNPDTVECHHFPHDTTTTYVDTVIHVTVSAITLHYKCQCVFYKKMLAMI